MPDEMPGHFWDHTDGRTKTTVWHDPSCTACPILGPDDAPHLSAWLNSKSTPPDPPPDVTIRKLADKHGKPPFKFDDPTEAF